MSRLLGIRGEAAVADYLRRKGYTLLCHSFHCRYGEIDLIAKKGGVVCFVEVKMRSNVQYGLPREAVTHQKQEKLRKTALFYLSVQDLDCPTRFDVAEVYTDDNGAPGRIEYIKNAF